MKNEKGFCCYRIEHLWYVLSKHLRFSLMVLMSTLLTTNVRALVKPQAQAFPLAAVKLLDGPLKQAMEVDKQFLMRVKPDRLLAGFRMEAGLSKKADPYNSPQWEAIIPGNRFTLTGHSLGHYLSALSMMAASTGDIECRHRADYIVTELKACQQAIGTGMLTSFPNSRDLFAELSVGKIETNHLFILNGGYVPFYSIHKVMAGLLDSWRLLGNEMAKDVLIHKADWLVTVFSKLTEAQVQEVLETEHGGIADILADVYSISGNESHIKMAQQLIHKKIFNPLAKGEDPLNTTPPAPAVHANAQIPIVIGMEHLYELTGEKPYADAAKCFWDNVVNTRSFVIGGHGANEFFFPVSEFPTTGLLSRGGPETCNTYNMLKLSRKLWLHEPEVPKADFIERCLYNHILGSQDPEEGGFTYYTSMRPGAYRVYCDAENDFWCCTGTGMENHAKYGEFIYAHSDKRLWVDLLVPSELNWTEQGVKVQLETRFPEDGKGTLTFTTKHPKNLTISIRCPGWLKSGAMKLLVNGMVQQVNANPGSYASLKRLWKNGDRLTVEWPLELRTELLPNSREWISILYGPIVLAGKLGTAGLEGISFHDRNYFPKKLPYDNVPVFIGSPNDILERIKPVQGKPLEFRSEGLATPQEVTLVPFYTIHKQRYCVYWQLKDQMIKPQSEPQKLSKVVAKGPYFGQELPGNTPTLFAPGIVSLPNFSEIRVVFSPHGKYLLFARSGSVYLC